ncbi:D-TA family PLP-dependent enzyme [Pseudoflavitalea rhizosphaerae]|uniref:D-TA family PLP-dependent enzyme n=1 Tax=Pseudoflavitalea rhizosphaerae TaxID=1884793 RepID=UPI000F8F341D|nr:D-TA family PLP-dependent enzyme [Pseudoflavitalea rhizosphaerae]
MTHSEQSWFLISDADQVDSPALILYPQRVQQNIDALIGMIDDKQRLRTHAKTHKTKEAAELQMKAGIRKFKCATIAEAELLAQAGVPDVLLAYQPVGPKQERFFNLIDKYPDTVFSCLIDNPGTAGELSAHFLTNGKLLPVYIDLNVGQNRTGIVPEKALALYEAAVALPGIELKGLHAYDGHIHHPDLEERKKIVDAAYARVEALAQSYIDKGYGSPIIVAGGTPGFPIHAKREKIECSPGTFIFWDNGYLNECPEQPFVPAAVLLTRVVSLPDDTKICVDLGHKSVSAENEISKRVYFLNAPELKPVGQSEEHLVLEAGTGHGYKVGDILYGIPHHVCPTVALYERGITVENSVVSGAWKIAARDRTIGI